VTVLVADAVRDDRFFQVNGRELTFDEVKKHIDDNRSRLKAVRLVVDQNSPHAAVTELSQFVADRRLTLIRAPGKSP
jgi:hypothetical protein